MSQAEISSLGSVERPIEPPTTARTVAVVMVTYNRRRLLEQTLQCIHAQTYPIARVIVVDNLSTDGSREFLRELHDPRIETLFMDRNVGGAGGFSAGIEHAFYGGGDLIWVMDDDVLPASDALEQLIGALAYLEKAGARPNFVTSNVFNASGEPVNAPVLDLRLQKNGNQRWPTFLREGMIPVVSASFVGPLILREAVARYGLPIAEMFIWGDDTEYTFRLSADGEAGYVVGNSRIVHLGRGTEVSIHQESDPARLGNFFYFYRNNTYIFRKYGTKQARVAFLYRLMHDIARLGVQLRGRKLLIVLRGVVCGLIFHPPVRHLTDENKSAAA